MISLEKFTADDYDRLISWVNSEELLMQFAGPGFNFPLTRKQLEPSVNESNRTCFKVIYHSRVIGHCELYLKEKSVVLARILIGEENMRGRGLGKEIVEAMLDYAFRHFTVDVAELNVFDHNKAAIRCYERVGFAIDHTIRMERKFRNEYWPASNMKITRQYWQTRAQDLQ